LTVIDCCNFQQTKPKHLNLVRRKDLSNDCALPVNLKTLIFRQFWAEIPLNFSELGKQFYEMKSDSA
jgi:hypothetical protein